MTSPTTLAPASGITANTSSLDNIIITKIENATKGLSFNCFHHLFNRVLPASRQNALTICDYMSSLRSEINPSIITGRIP